VGVDTVTAESSGRVLGGRGRRSLVTGVGLIVSNVLPGFLMASLAPRIRVDFAFSKSSLGLAVALFYVVSAVWSVPAGRLVDRLGADWGFRLSAAFTVVSCLAIVALAQSAVSLTLLMLAGGVGTALGGPTVSALLRREVAVHRQGLAFGAQQAGAPIGAMLAGLALPAVAIPFGWRWAFAAAAVLAALAVVCSPGVTPAAASRPPAGRRPAGFSSVHALALTAVLASAAGVGFVSFLVTYSVDSGISETAAGVLLAGVSLTATLSRIAFGHFADRTARDPLSPVAIMLMLSAPGFLLLAVGEPVVIALAALLAGGLGWAWPGGLTLAVVQRSPEAPAWAVGVMMTGLFVGAVGGPLLTGFLAEQDEFTLAWIACAAFALGAASTVAATLRRERAAR
jgi:MFS family permease